MDLCLIVINIALYIFSWPLLDYSLFRRAQGRNARDYLIKSTERLEQVLGIATG